VLRKNSVFFDELTIEFCFFLATDLNFTRGDFGTRPLQQKEIKLELLKILYDVASRRLSVVLYRIKFKSYAIIF